MRRELVDDLTFFNRGIVSIAASGILYQVAAIFVQDFQLQLLNQFGYLSLVGTSFLILTALNKFSQRPATRQWHKFSFIIDSLAILLCLMSIAVVQGYERMPNTHWEGFGQTVAATSLVLALLAMVMIAKGLSRTSNRASIFRSFISSLAMVLVFRAIPGLIQPPNALLNVNDQTYIVLEETLAQYNGFVPDVNYLRVYSSLYGWLFKSFSWIDFDKSLMMPIIIWFYNLLALSTLLIAAFIMWLSYKRRSAQYLLWTFSAVVLLASLSGKEGATTSMFSNLGWVVRFNFPFAALLCMVLVGGARRVSSCRITIVAAGIFTGLAVLNSPDSGLVFGMAVLISLVIHRIFQKQWPRHTAYLTAAFLATILAYWVVLEVWTTGFSLDMYLSLVRKAQAGGAYETGSITVTGPHLLIYVIAFSTIVKSLYVLGKRQGDLESFDNPILPLVALVSAIWLILSSLKYLIVGHPTYLGGGLFVQAVICGGLLIAMTHLQLGDFQTLRNIRGCVRVFPSLILLGLPFAASLQTADWQVETKRLLGYANESGWAKEQDRAPAGGWTKSFLLEKGTTRHPSQWLDALYKLSDSQKNGAESIVYFGEFSNTVELLTGIQSIMPTSAPEHMRFGDYFKSQACSLIDSETTYRFIAVFGSEVPCRGLVYLGEDKSGLIGLWEEKD